MSLEIKVCGNTEFKNFSEVCNLNPEYVGFIFYPKSKRYVESPSLITKVESCKSKRVGVFVNATEQEIRDKVIEFNLDFIQLHGDETATLTAKINEFIPAFKTFQINNNFDFNILIPYLSTCYKFIFDTSSKDYGGSGKKFNWELLENYTLHKPFILSGGIEAEDVEKIRTLSHPMLSGIDLNSKFEISPGIKDIPKLSAFIKKIRK